MPRSRPVPVTGFAAEQDLAFVLRIEPDDEPQQRRLAAAAGADDADELPGRHVQVDVFEHLQFAVLGLAVGVALAERADVEFVGGGRK